MSRPAIISGSAAFFAPEIGMVPLSLLPPTIRMRSMPIPAFCYAQSIRRMRPLWQKREICGYLMGFDRHFAMPAAPMATGPELYADDFQESRFEIPVRAEPPKPR